MSLNFVDKNLAEAADNVLCLKGLKRNKMAGGNEKNKKRKRWVTEDEEKLIDLWGDNILELRKSKRNSHVYAAIASDMRKFTAEEVHVKISNFTQRYRTERKNMGCSGGSPSSWKYYKQIHKLLGQFKCNNMDTMEESFVMNTPEETPDSEYLIEYLDEEPESHVFPYWEEESGQTPQSSTSIPGESSSASRRSFPEISTDAPSTSAASSVRSINRKQNNLLNIQKDMLEIMKENQEVMKNNLRASEINNKEHLELSKRSLEIAEKNSEIAQKFADNFVELSDRQYNMQKEYLEFFKGSFLKQ